MDLTWFDFFSSQNNALTQTDAGFLGLTANRRWKQEVNDAAPSLAAEIQDKSNKFIFVPGVNSTVGGAMANDISYAEVNKIADVFHVANTDKQVVFCHSAGTQVCLESLKDAKADFYIFASPRVSRSTFEQMIHDAGLKPEQVLVVTAADDYPHWPTDVIFDPEKLAMDIAKGNLVDAVHNGGTSLSDMLQSSFYDYENNKSLNGELKYNYLFLKEDLTHDANRILIKEQLGHAGMIGCALEDHSYDAEYNGEDILNGAMKEIYENFVKEKRNE